MITALKVLFGMLLVWMCFQVISTSLQSNLFDEWNSLAAIPWMRATLWDFYVNVLVLALWVCYKESSLLKKIIWILLLVCLGSIATCAYLLVQLFKLKKGQTVKDLLCHKNL